MSIVLVLPPCRQCVSELDQQSQQQFNVEVRSDEAYHLTCPNGHESLVLLQHLNFEVLFEMGLLALLDGYYREAVLDFAVSTERFIEFFIHFIQFKQNVHESELRACWKRLAKQSERQLGAFFALYTLNYGTEPQYLSNAAVELRNRVAHRGHVPTRSEAIMYGDAVLAFIRPMLRDIKTNSGVARGKAMSFGRIRSINEAVPTSGAVFETALSIAYAPRCIDDYSIEQLLDYYPWFLRQIVDKNLMGFTLSSAL